MSSPPHQCQNYSVSTLVLENQPPGTFVLRVHAHDADIGLNGEVKYGIMQRDGASSGFVIDPDTGRVSLSVSESSSYHKAQVIDRVMTACH